ncbi:carboxylesterase family protein [Martelella soudanensis]|uniref:carboxylesterase family protein n=1 Tax=unclassified Martelella TaxID=2629616 RepID=UPI0015DFA978|nr:MULTISPECIES: carboxylesterase family protein [unclassified Martelella]
MSTDRAISATSRRATYHGLLDGRVARFLNIRYAAPPLGPLRFRPPQGIENEGGIDARMPGFAPPQQRNDPPAWAPRGAGFQTGEDCLNLNVWTPAIDGGKRPVIVHAFGGGFQAGAGQGSFHDEPGFVARGDVVLVRPNMRVGAPGFLHLAKAFGPEYAAANRGMLDFIAALEWVRDNIAAFGGDPDNVTLAGMSSGAFTISALFGVDGAAGLFRRVWVMSGPASRIIDQDTATDMAADFLARAGVEPGDEAALQALGTDDILDLQGAVLATHLGERNAPGGRTFGIVLDGASLNRHPMEGLATGCFRDHRIVAGWTRDEARMWYAMGVMPAVKDRAGVLRTVRLFCPENAEARLAALEGERPGASFSEYEEIFLSRTIYRDPAIAMLAAHRDAGGTGYGYEFRWTPQSENARFGAAHGFDEPFVFASVDRFPLANGDAGAARLAEAMSGALIDYARTGDPGWPASSAGNGYTCWDQDF